MISNSISFINYLIYITFLATYLKTIDSTLVVDIEMVFYFLLYYDTTILFNKIVAHY